jgi:hypothetical protein
MKQKDQILISSSQLSLGRSQHHSQADPFSKKQSMFTKSENQLDFAAGQLALEESIKLIIDLSCHYPVLTIFIDALDECDPERRSDLLDAFETILREAPTLVNLLCVSMSAA